MSGQCHSSHTMTCLFQKKKFVICHISRISAPKIKSAFASQTETWEISVPATSAIHPEVFVVPITETRSRFAWQVPEMSGSMSLISSCLIDSSRRPVKICHTSRSIRTSKNCKFDLRDNYQKWAVSVIRHVSWIICWLFFVLGSCVVCCLRCGLYILLCFFQLGMVLLYSSRQTFHSFFTFSCSPFIVFFDYVLFWRLLLWVLWSFRFFFTLVCVLLMTFWIDWATAGIMGFV